MGDLADVENEDQMNAAQMIEVSLAGISPTFFRNSWSPKKNGEGGEGAVDREQRLFSAPYSKGNKEKGRNFAGVVNVAK